MLVILSFAAFFVVATEIKTYCYRADRYYPSNERGSKLAVVVFGVMIVLAMVLGLVAALKGLSMREMVELGSNAVASKAVRHTVADRITAIEAKKPLLKQVAKSAGGQLRLLVFKAERRLEVHAPGWVAPRVYPMTGFSGTLGPKLKEGDGQIPEGIYGIEYLNPNSSYYLSLKVSYPNATDRARALADKRTNLGGDIMIHGKNVTIGCVPISDDAIEDVFYLANAVGIKNVSVVIAPYDLRKGRRLELEKSPLPWYPDLCREIDIALSTPVELYRRFLVRPSTDSLMDVVISCSGKKDGALMAVLEDELAKDARVLFSEDGHAIDSHSVGVFLVENLIGEEAPLDGQSDWCVIFSRAIPDEEEAHRQYKSPWREHLFATTPKALAWAKERLSEWGGCK